MKSARREPAKGPDAFPDPPPPLARMLNDHATWDGSAAHNGRLETADYCGWGMMGRAGTGAGQVREGFGREVSTFRGTRRRQTHKPHDDAALA